MSPKTARVKYTRSMVNGDRLFILIHPFFDRPAGVSGKEHDEEAKANCADTHGSKGVDLIHLLLAPCTMLRSTVKRVSNNRPARAAATITSPAVAVILTSACPPEGKSTEWMTMAAVGVAVGVAVGMGVGVMVTVGVVVAVGVEVIVGVLVMVGVIVAVGHGGSTSHGAAVAVTVGVAVAGGVTAAAKPQMRPFSSVHSCAASARPMPMSSKTVIRRRDDLSMIENKNGHITHLEHVMWPWPYLECNCYFKNLCSK